MIKMNHYLDKKGNIDFTAYHKAQKDAGERCRKCNTFMLFNAKGFPSTCAACQRLDRSLKEEQFHDHRIRCPKCHQSFDAHHYASELADYEIYQEQDECEICCVFCEYIFTISVSVTYTFYSPAILDDTSAAGN